MNHCKRKQTYWMLLTTTVFVEHTSYKIRENHRELLTPRGGWCNSLHKNSELDNFWRLQFMYNVVIAYLVRLSISLPKPYSETSSSSRWLFFSKTDISLLNSCCRTVRNVAFVDEYFGVNKIMSLCIFVFLIDSLRSTICN